MKNNNRDLDITFYPKQKLGQISFSSHEEDVLTVLGRPSEREVYYYTPAGEEAIVASNEKSNLQYSINMFYSSFAVFIGYEGNKYQGASVHLDDLILEGNKFSEMGKYGILDCIKKYHNRNNISFACLTSSNDLLKEECYEYENIGLIIWFEKEIISNICVQDPSTWDK